MFQSQRTIARRAVTDVMCCAFGSWRAQAQQTFEKLEEEIHVKYVSRKKLVTGKVVDENFCEKFLDCVLNNSNRN